MWHPWQYKCRCLASAVVLRRVEKGTFARCGGVVDRPHPPYRLVCGFLYLVYRQHEQLDRRGDLAQGLRDAQSGRACSPLLHLSCVGGQCGWWGGMRYCNVVFCARTRPSRVPHHLDNMELALQWEESQRAAMYDPSLAGYFVHALDGSIYNEPQGTYGDQFFWDFRNESASQYFIASVLESVSTDDVDGSFTDDVDGMPAEHPNAPARCGLTDEALADLRWGTQATHMALVESLVSASKYKCVSRVSAGGHTTLCCLRTPPPQRTP